MKKGLLVFCMILIHLGMGSGALAQCENSDWSEWSATCIPGIDFRVKYGYRSVVTPPRNQVWYLEFRNNTGSEYRFNWALLSPNDPAPGPENNYYGGRRSHFAPHSVYGAGSYFLDVDCTSHVWLYTWDVLVDGVPSLDSNCNGEQIDVETPEAEGGGGGDQGTPLPPPEPAGPPTGGVPNSEAYECTRGGFMVNIFSDLYPVTVRWEVGGVLQAPQEVQWGQPGSYRIPSVSLADHGKQARALLSTSAGSTWTNYGTLTVIPAEAPAVLEKSPAVQTVTEGEFVRIQMTYSGTPPFTQEILFNGEPIAAEVPRFLSGRTGVFFYQAGTAHAGTYTLRVSNCGGVLEEDFTLAVNQVSPTSALENPMAHGHASLDGLRVHWPTSPSYREAEGQNGERWFMGLLRKDKAITFGSTFIPASGDDRYLLLRYSRAGIPLSAVVLPPGTTRPQSLAVANNGDVLLGTELYQKPSNESGLFWRYDFGATRIENNQKMSLMIRLSPAGQYLGYRYLCSGGTAHVVTELPDARLGVVAVTPPNTTLYDAAGNFIALASDRFGRRTHAFILDAAGVGQSTAEEIFFTGGIRDFRTRPNGEMTLLTNSESSFYIYSLDWDGADGSHLRTDGVHTQIADHHWGGANESAMLWNEDGERQLIMGGFDRSVSIANGGLVVANSGEKNAIMLSLTEPGINFDNLQITGTTHLHQYGQYIESLAILPLDNGEWMGAFRTSLNAPIDLGNGVVTPPFGYFLLRVSRGGVALEVIPLDYHPLMAFRDGNRVRIWGLGNTAHGQAVDFPYLSVDYDLRPFAAPQVDSITGPTEVVVGTPATFTANVTGDGTMIYQWRVNGVAVAGATTAEFTHTFTEDYGPSLVQVEAANRFGLTARGDHQVQVVPTYPAPLLTELSGPAAVQPGEWVELTITAAGEGDIHYIWYRNGAPISGNDQPFLRMDLHSSALYATDTFQVVAYNEAGSTASNILSIAITNDPHYGEDYIDWAIRNIIGPVGAGVSWWEEQDANGDGLINRFSYHSGADPLVGDAYPAFSMTGNVRRFDYAVSLRVPGIQVFLERSDDARTWTTLNSSPVYLRQEGHRAIWRHSVNEVRQSSRFYRLKYVKP